MSWAQVPTFLRDKEQRVYLNPAKDWVQPFELPTSKPNQIVVIPAGGRVGPFPLTAQYDGPIECFYQKAVVYDDADVPVTDYDIDFLLEHPGKRIQFSPRFVPLIACVGDGGRPYVLPETIFIPPVQSLNITFVNNDLVNERRVEFVMGGIKFYPNQAPDKIRREVWEYIERRERTYAYFNTTDEEAVLAAGALDDPNFMTIPDNADFEVFKLTARATAAFRCRIRDGQNDRALTGDKLHSSILFGAHQATAAGSGVGGSGGIFPARWATSWLIRRSVKMQLDLDNLSVAPNTVKLVFGGRKISYVS
ncbi:MAG: hypothetical protein ACRD1P_11550 [Thermoanaerobaculia bacterium]